MCEDEKLTLWDRWYQQDLARHPDCRDPDHPGCLECEPLEEDEMITDRLRKDARFMKVLPTQGNAVLIDATEVDNISSTMLDAAARIEELEKAARAAGPSLPQVMRQPELSRWVEAMAEWSGSQYEDVVRVSYLAALFADTAIDLTEVDALTVSAALLERLHKFAAEAAEHYSSMNDEVCQSYSEPWQEGVYLCGELKEVIEAKP